MKIKLLMLTFLVSSANASSAPLLNLPLGGRITLPIATCRDRDAGLDVKTICWVGKPRRSAYGLAGSAKIPDGGTLPKWASTVAYFDLRISPKNILYEIEGRIEHWGATKDDIARSISLRLGQPTTTNLHRDGITGATWDHEQMFARLTCSDGEFCTITFTSREAHAIHLKELAVRDKENSARPISP